MRAAPKPHNETQRLAALKRYAILDTGAEQAYDDITLLAKTICETPIALISLVDEHRQWFKSKQGLEASETPRELAFCAHAILGEQVLEVPNALDDERFCDNPLVASDPSIRFYAGAPLVTHDGFRLGTLCTISDQPKYLTEQQRSALEALARQVMYLFELRLHNQELRVANDSKRKLFSTISHDLRAPFNVIQGCASRLNTRAESLSTEQIQDLSGRLLRTSKLALSQLETLVEWAQTQMQAIHFNPKPTHLKSLVSDVLLGLDPELAGKAVSLHNTIGDDVVVNADPMMLRSAIHNLVTNGVKFTPAEGSVTVSAASDGAKVTIGVSDTGIGMDADMQAKFIADGALTTSNGTDNEKGFGLGLILVREYLAYHHTHLSVASAAGKGTRFQFTLEAVE